MPRHGSAASAVVALALLASLASGATAKGCNGEFECSGFDFSFGNGSLSHTPLVGGSPVCTYGHIEVGGTCDKPCSGLRRATCRCKTKTEAEDAVAFEALNGLYISIGVLVVGLAAVGFSLKRRMRAGRGLRKQEEMMEEDPAPAGQSSPEVMAPAQMAEPAVLQATVVSVSDPSQPEGNQQPAQGAVVIGKPLQKSPSQLQIVANRNPAKSSLATAVLVVLLPVSLIGYWVMRLMQSGRIFDDFGLFMGFLGVICYVGYFSAHVVLAMKGGIPAFVETVKRNPFLFFVSVQRRLCWFLPLIGGAGLVWAVRRMADPAGVYSAC